ncbi:glycosyltransferase family 2 protein [Candidatus Nitrotoga arctica]|uniref:CPS-53 (KpLE1) prophage bactoprenol glucosyl transferase n=1 Tax=Candidatus Nitrotoga arctica TaxID=453162 RepID=A0ABN8AKX2_9PROT|nr:glycosyltransferase family 2 protein [Candidatus Nitrotoga arctica]CAG9931872.1 CPS-53 (KpLE1) prophage; bactoprenol glucosyl transferase [Candidatus Nitrotoga arctica]
MQTTQPIVVILVSIILPFFNEAEGIPLFFERLDNAISNIPDCRFELICINDGSRDRTLPALEFAKKRYPAITIIDFTRNFGKEAALTAGLEFAAGDAVIIMDSDLQHPPELIPAFIQKWRSGVPVVLAKRNSRSTESVLYRLLAGMFYRLHNNISNIKIPTNTGDFRLIDRQVCDALKRLPESHRFMKGLFAWVGYEYELVEYDVAPRAHGRTSFNKWKSLNFALEGITGFSTVPLRVWTYAGLLVTAVGFFYACWVILRAIFLGIDTPGYVTLLTTVVFFGGLQLIGIGVLGEYIGRIYIETKNRPIYLVKKIIK